MIAYTPETYVVHYGTDMSALDEMSDTVTSGSDFKITNQQFSILLTDLMVFTQYYYQLVATNTFKSTTSPMMSIMTAEKGELNYTLALPEALHKTFPYLSAPGKVSNIEFTGNNDSILVVSWDVPMNRNGIILQYTVTVSEWGAGFVITVMNTTDTANLEIADEHFSKCVVVNI